MILSATSYRSSIKFKVTLLVIVGAACFASGIVAPCLPLIADYFKVTSHDTSALVSNFLFGYLIGQIFYSILSQIIGYKKTLILGFLIYFSACILQIIAIKIASFHLLYYARFICALGASSGLICTFSIINDLFENKVETQKLISLAFIFLTIFSYISISIGGLITQYLGWRFVFYFMISLALINLILVFKYIANINNNQTQTLSYSKILLIYLRSMFNYNLITASLTISFTTTATYLYNAIGATLSRTLFHISPLIFGFISIVNLIGLILGGWLCSKLLIRYKTCNVLIGGIFLSALPISALFLLQDFIFVDTYHGLLFFSAVFVLNCGLGFIYPSASYLALNSVTYSVTASSIMNFLKIACPAFTIYFVSKSHLDLIASYRIPLVFIFLIALLSCLVIKSSGKLKNL